MSAPADAERATGRQAAPGVTARPRSRLLEVALDAATVARKDLRVELRSREILLTMGYFGFLVVLVFAFSFSGGRSVPAPPLVAGILWVAVALSGTLGLGRAFEREREGDCLRALLLTPVARPAIYLGKTLGVLLFMIVVEAIVLPAVLFFFNVRLSMETLGQLLLTLGLGTVGYAILGTLLAAMLARARAKDVLLAVVFYPLVLPVLIVGVKASTAILDPLESIDALGTWLRLLGAFDIAFGLVALWIFEPLVTD
jgi:heme exporter protein CcmB